MSRERKFRICDALNTWMPALNILRAKGYKVFIRPNSRAEFYGDFWAIKDDRDFIASNPLELFGLIAIWEAHGDGDGWQPKNQDYADIQDELATIAFPNDPYTDLSDETVSEFLEYWSPYFDAVSTGSERPKNREELFKFFTSTSEE
jgi:hypothetical protein